MSATGPDRLEGVVAMRVRMRIAIVVALGAVVLGGTSAAPASAGSVRWPAVQRGDSGLNVRAVQALLREHGSSVSVTGHFRFGTAQAVRRFQDAHGIAATGKVDKATWPDLVVVVQRGDEGPAVQVIQRQLKWLGFYHAAIGGHFGPRTEGAVKAFQERAGLEQTGVMNTFSWRHLLHSIGFPSCLRARCD
jgi:peptidoglycan hydrolase-like protein with peptidoglycan-binding domain